MKARIHLAGAMIAITLLAGGPLAAAEEQMNSIQTALSATTISGYVDTSISWHNSKDYTVVVVVKPPAPSQLSKVWWSRLWMWLVAHGWV